MDPHIAMGIRVTLRPVAVCAVGGEGSAPHTFKRLCDGESQICAVEFAS